MSGSSQLTSARRIIVLTIAIPAVGSAVTIRSLAQAAVTAAGESIDQIVGWNISGVLADRTTQRPAMAIGHSVASCVSTYAIGQAVSPPVSDDTTFVGGVAGAITTAVIELYIK